ncbi:MAG: 30S ribosomal protein S8 [Candidatus Portnoybacteria bacterium CG02_land_8_20_14_3_00_45_8]|uniref:Small ribosomal subunit protein uS8 n=1 Tax=Candidatus Portnoybacteria bacterium CG02_land_8_20_14_3_00_45_8 TaxID=1974807 RepID=A0A2M7D6C6_9BACT|nr:MAG: 30S ribosomal protein S8 [Candidatus Portnoybacteria bacterium CG02_land_8_20_14_3_00_45_8]
MDIIADLLIQIKNAQQAGRAAVVLPFSKLKLALAKILEKEGFVGSVEKKGAKPKEKLEITLKYDQGLPAIQGVKRISKLGRRLYIQADKIRSVRQGYGVAIISTSQGLMTDKEARRKKLGGEYLCEVW